MNSFNTTDYILSIDNDENVQTIMDSKGLFDYNTMLETKTKSSTDKLQTTTNEIKVDMDINTQIIRKFEYEYNKTPTCVWRGTNCENDEYIKGVRNWPHFTSYCCKMPMIAEINTYSKKILPPTVSGDPHHYICNTQCKSESICIVDSSKTTPYNKDNPTPPDKDNKRIYYSCPL